MSALMDAFEPLMREQIATGIGPQSIDISYQRLGNPDAPAVVLIMGLAAQLIHWPDDFCYILLERGLQVIRFDNRDSGLSTHVRNAPKPDLAGASAGDFSSAAYNLSDMAADTVGLMDALGIEKAHLVGASMGGFIAQTIAIEHPARVRSLCSMMSSTGNKQVGQASKEVMRELFRNPPATTRERVAQQMVRAVRLVGSPDYPMIEHEVKLRAERAFDRGYDPIGTARQAVASIASGDRSERLRELQVPTLVIHGLADQMCDVSGGRATAEAIPGAELLLIEGMGHDLAPELRLQLASRLADFIQRTDRTYTT